jgi:hypothetical protein
MPHEVAGLITHDWSRANLHINHNWLEHDEVAGFIAHNWLSNGVNSSEVATAGHQLARGCLRRQLRRDCLLVVGAAA